MELNGKRIIVTGGSRGIGAEMVRALAAAGASVMSVDVLDDEGQAVVAAANQAGGRVDYRHCDIARREDVETAFKEAAEVFGGIDGLVNAAGIERHTNPEDISDEEWDRTIAVNLTGTFLTNQVAFRHLREKGGRILNFGSDAGLINYSSAPHYSATKGAVASWTRSVAGAWGRYGITVNTIVPAMWTPMYDDHRALFSVDELTAHDAQMANIIAIDGRLGNPARDLAPFLLFMLSDGARYITGQILSVNGGLNGTR